MRNKMHLYFNKQLEKMPLFINYDARNVRWATQNAAEHMGECSQHKNIIKIHSKYHEPQSGFDVSRTHLLCDLRALPSFCLLFLLLEFVGALTFYRKYLARSLIFSRARQTSTVSQRPFAWQTAQKCNNLQRNLVHSFTKKHRELSAADFECKSFDI